MPAVKKSTLPSLEVLIGQAEALTALGRLDAAAELYQAWIADNQGSDVYIACYNLGVLLVSLNALDQAQLCYQRCIDAQPQFLEARINLGWVLERLGQERQAIRAWKQVVAHAPVGQADTLAVTALNHIGRLLEKNKQYGSAEIALHKSLQRNPNQPDVLQHWIFLRMKQCKWPVRKKFGGIELPTMLKHTSPLAALALSDDPALQWIAAQQLIDRKYASLGVTSHGTSQKRHKRLRLGYLSADFCTHAVGLLLPGLLGAHDRREFEVFAFDDSQDDASLCRHQLMESVEHWVPVRGMTDVQIVECIKLKGIDILIDLHGLSAGARPGVLAQRAAPLQGTYLGFMGTTGLPWLDFVVTDKYMWPADAAHYFAEKPLYVAPSLFVLEGLQDASIDIDRQSLGLPEKAVVLGCFNHVYKINPTLWRHWMNILKASPKSVLWLLDDNPSATRHLKREAAKQGVDASRLFFTNRTGYDDYRKRLNCIDLYLDTFPYNAGSTARDVIECGVPLLTCSGRTMVSRMAGSLLNALHMPELITPTLNDYEFAAIAFANKPKKLRLLKTTLMNAVQNQAPTAKKVAKSLERGLSQLYHTMPKA